MLPLKLYVLYIYRAGCAISGSLLFLNLGDTNDGSLASVCVGYVANTLATASDTF